MKLLRTNGELIGEGETLAEIVAANKANLSEANLRGANLRWANLSGANLRGANLRWANLRGTGCVQMVCGPWFIWITPERCSIGCQDHPHEFWQSATPESVASMHSHASEFWSLWGEMILAACRACAKHGWPMANG